MFLRTFTENPSWHIFLSEYNALELDGPGVGFLLKVSTVLTALSILGAVHLSVRLLRRFTADSARLHEAMILAILTIVLLTILANKTLSPQYVLWLGGPVAALLVCRTSAWLRRHVVVLALAMVVIGGLTQYTYPWGAYGIMAIPLGSGPETSVLLLRNLGLIAITIYAYWLTLHASGRSLAETPLERRSETLV